jgi:hypothetical protein
LNDRRARHFASKETANHFRITTRRVEQIRTEGREATELLQAQTSKIGRQVLQGNKLLQYLRQATALLEIAEYRELLHSCDLLEKKVDLKQRAGLIFAQAFLHAHGKCLATEKRLMELETELKRLKTRQAADDAVSGFNGKAVPALTSYSTKRGSSALISFR